MLFQIPKSWEMDLITILPKLHILLGPSWGSKKAKHEKKYFYIIYLSTFKAAADTIS